MENVGSFTDTNICHSILGHPRHGPLAVGQNLISSPLMVKRISPVLPSGYALPLLCRVLVHQRGEMRPPNKARAHGSKMKPRPVPRRMRPNPVKSSITVLLHFFFLGSRPSAMGRPSDGRSIDP